MQLGVVRCFGVHHAEEDFEESLPQASQRAGVAHALPTFLLIISLAPAAGFAKAIRPQMNCVAHELVTRPAETDFADFA